MDIEISIILEIASYYLCVSIHTNPYIGDSHKENQE